MPSFFFFFFSWVIIAKTHTSLCEDISRDYNQWKLFTFHQIGKQMNIFLEH